MLSALSVCFVLEFRLFFPLRRTAGINRGDDKSTLLDGQAQKLGRLPAKLLQHSWPLGHRPLLVFCLINQLILSLETVELENFRHIVIKLTADE